VKLHFEAKVLCLDLCPRDQRKARRDSEIQHSSARRLRCALYNLRILKGKERGHAQIRNPMLYPLELRAPSTECITSKNT